MATGEPACWADVQEEEERLANLPPDLIEPLIPLPGPRRANDGFQNALEDPLGVAPARALELALSRARAPDASFTAGSISLSSADFNPITFLAEDTKLEDLLAGMATLNSIVASQTTQMKTLAQENFDQFVLCKDTIDEIAAEINKVESSADGTTELVKEVTLLHSKAQSFFSPLLEQKAQGDRARRHLEALKRYDFLLRLPRAIEEHAAKEEYEQVVANYSRAKMLLSGKATTRRTKVVIRILSEVEERVAALRSRLYRRLDAAELPKEEAKRVLSELDGQPDPAEYYLSKQRAHVRRLLLAVKVSSTSPAKSIRKLRNIFATHAIDLWRLSVTLSATDPKRKEQFVALISELAQIYSQQVRSTVLENKTQQQQQQATAVREAVAELTQSAVAVSEAQLPASVVETVQKLQIEIVQSLIADLAAQTRRDAGLLYLEQDWRTGLHGTTSMPSDFALLFREALAQLRAIIPTENDVLEKQGAAALLDSARAFADSLHHLGVTQRLAGVSTSSIIRLQVDEQVLSVSPHKQLLLTLSDCIYTRSTLLPELAKAASKLLPRAATDIQKGLEDLLDTFRHLESLVSAKYLRAHAAEVRHALLGSSDWLSAEEPQGVSPFILRALLIVAAASSDLAAVVPALHTQIVGLLAEVTLQSLSDAVAVVEEASPRGAVQLEVDLTITQTALSRFRTPAADAWLSQLSSAVRHLQPKNRTAEEKEEKERLVASVLARCTAMLDSLRPR